MYPPHHTGGYELVWRAAMEHLRAAGHEVRVLATDHREATGQADDAGVFRELRWYWRDHEILTPGLAASLRLERHNQRVLRRHLDGFAPDVVAWWSMGAMSMAMLETVRQAGLPAVAFVHDDWLDYGRRTDGWYRRFRRRPRLGALAQRVTGVPTRVEFAKAARYEFVSETTRSRALMSGVAIRESGIAHSGIDPAYLAPAPERPWGWQLLYVGRIDPRKGIDTAVEALAHLPAEAHLIVVGSGDDRERARLAERIAELGVGARVTFAGGRSRDELAGDYAAADAVLFPVRWSEPWGLVPLEAMAFGRPVVATGRGGSGEYLRDGENCVLFDAGDAQGLAAAVVRLAEDEGLRARLREGGFPTAAAHTEEHLNRAVAAALERAVAAGPIADEPAAPPEPGAPELSVVIPTLGRTERLARTLAALAAQDVDPRRFEVIVVGDPGDDLAALDAAIDAAGRPYAARRLIREAPAVGAARNLGWRSARAPVVLFLGDDILGAPRLVAEHLAWHARHPDPRDGVLGHVTWARELEITPFMRWLERGLQFDYFSIDGIDAGFGHFYTANISVKRSLLERVGGFDEERFPFLYEDLDLGYRLHDVGFRLLYNRRARAEHLHPTTIEGWAPRMAATATAERRWVALHPELPAYFHDRLRDAASRAPSRGRAERLLRFTPRRTPWLGPKVWRNASVHFRQQLAPAYLAVWDAEEEAG